MKCNLLISTHSALYVFTARHYASAVYAVVVCLSHSGIVSNG